MSVSDELDEMTDALFESLTAFHEGWHPEYTAMVHAKIRGALEVAAAYRDTTKHPRRFPDLGTCFHGDRCQHCYDLGGPLPIPEEP